MWYQLEYIKLKHMDPNSQQIETVVMKMVWVWRDALIIKKKIPTCLQNYILTSTIFCKETFLITNSPFIYMTLQFWRSDFQMEVAGYF
jgi:hypothetical protein